MTIKKNHCLHRSPLHLLHRAAQCANELFQREVATAGLTPRQLAVLLTVAEREGLSQTGVVERTGIDRSTLAELVQRLAKKGLLQRRRTKHDARAYAVKLTDEGRRVLHTAVPLAMKVDEHILQTQRGSGDELLRRLQAIVKTLQVTGCS